MIDLSVLNPISIREEDSQFYRKRFCKRQIDCALLARVCCSVSVRHFRTIQRAIKASASTADLRFLLRELQRQSFCLCVLQDLIVRNSGLEFVIFVKKTTTKPAFGLQEKGPAHPEFSLDSHAHRAERLSRATQPATAAPTASLVDGRVFFPL